MSQENPTPEQIRKSKETRNMRLLGGLLVALVGVIYCQFFSGSDASGSPPPQGVAKGSARTTPSPTPPRQTSGTPAPIISQPLDLASIEGGSRSSGGIGRNIF